MTAQATEVRVLIQTTLDDGRVHEVELRRIDMTRPDGHASLKVTPIETQEARQVEMGFLPGDLFFMQPPGYEFDVAFSIQGRLLPDENGDVTVTQFKDPT